jgi:hypothetical protein
MVKIANSCPPSALLARRFILVGPAGSSSIHAPYSNNGSRIEWRANMDPIFSAAIEHIRVMEARIAKQESAIERLRMRREELSDAERRLKLLRAALEEMRIQLAQLTPTAQQVAAPAWALPLAASTTNDTPSATGA